MITYFLILFYLAYIYAFEPVCSSCKFFIPYRSNLELGLCELFTETGPNGVLLKNFASHCRNNENLCGKSGLLYEPIKENEENEENKEVTNVKRQLDNMCCGEVNESKEIEEYENMERELFDVLQKIKRHNTRRIYKTSKDLYKLFKRNF